MVSVIIGEGGSGGAVAFATANRVAMLEHSIYSVISPEGCASILWKDAEKMREAAEALRLTAQDLLKLGVIDRIIAEPTGGAQRDRTGGDRGGRQGDRDDAEGAGQEEARRAGQGPAAEVPRHGDQGAGGLSAPTAGLPSQLHLLGENTRGGPGAAGPALRLRFGRSALKTCHWQVFRARLAPGRSDRAAIRSFAQPCPMRFQASSPAIL